jgi:hypothetical protein
MKLQARGWKFIRFVMERRRRIPGNSAVEMPAVAFVVRAGSRSIAGRALAVDGGGFVAA